MKNITVTYDVMVVENKEEITGETCMTISVMDHVAENLVTTGKSGVAVRQIEKALAALENLKGRTYITSSIKHYAYAE